MLSSSCFKGDFMSIQNNFNINNNFSFDFTDTSSDDEVEVSLTASDSILPDAKRSRSSSHENTETSSDSLELSLNALDLYCPSSKMLTLPPITKTLSFETIPTAVAYGIQSTIHLNPKKTLKRALIFYKFFKLLNEEILHQSHVKFGLKKKLGIKIGYISISIKNDKNILMNLFNECISTRRHAITFENFLKNLAAIDRFEIRVSKKINKPYDNYFISLPKGVMVSFTGGTGDEDFKAVATNEIAKEIVDYTSLFFITLSELIYNKKISETKINSLLSLCSREKISFTPLTPDQLKFVNVEDRESMQAFIEYAVYETQKRFTGELSRDVINELSSPNVASSSTSSVKRNRASISLQTRTEPNTFSISNVSPQIVHIPGVCLTKLIRRALLFKQIFEKIEHSLLHNSEITTGVMTVKKVATGYFQFKMKTKDFINFYNSCNFFSSSGPALEYSKIHKYLRTTRVLKVKSRLEKENENENVRLTFLLPPQLFTDVFNGALNKNNITLRTTEESKKIKDYLSSFFEHLARTVYGDDFSLDKLYKSLKANSSIATEFWPLSEEQLKYVTVKDKINMNAYMEYAVHRAKKDVVRSTDAHASLPSAAASSSSSRSIDEISAASGLFSLDS